MKKKVKERYPNKGRRLAFEKFHPTLVLNASYQPISVVNWKKAILLWFQDKVEVVEFYRTKVHSTHESFSLPSIMRLHRYTPPPYYSQKIRLSRRNLFLRDKHCCQYCGRRFSEKKLTIDHVIPLSKGGKHNWKNVVTACSSCNNKKGNSIPEKNTLLSRPSTPRWLPTQEFDFENKTFPHGWAPYINK